jgi:serine/threonine protein kinase
VKLGRYRIVRRLAVGGMAEIFLARLSGPGDFEKTVVLKRLLPQFAADRTFVQMFHDEARLSARLQHPNVAQVFDIDRDGEQQFLVLEYVPGRSVQDALQRARERSERLELDAALGIALGMCAGLHHAHEQRGPDGRPLGIVHRDVSPSNVIVSYDGAVKVVDFGIAKAASSSTVTRDAFVKGKVAYMAPEQCTGGQVDRRSDVFAIGVVLFELTTGTRLYTADSDWAVMRQITDDDAPAATTRNPDLPPALGAILARALSRDPSLRHATALELQLDLENFARESQLSPSGVEIARLMAQLFPGERDAPPEGSAAGLEAPTRRPRRAALAVSLTGAVALACGILGHATTRDAPEAPTYQAFAERIARSRALYAASATAGVLAGAAAAFAIGRRGR